ncbi:RNA polymerase sigma-70 factor (ECF subfamily) [Roseimicrobium gellanilyticum]|uniref:RNA polymerase sigma-70 factor (ECF subfamily) n=1 Tax=Roseimicrobium gellanilyticum TaxID=748857 RepID=A0A366H604_9BACT|nr:sigma-70 family RNA polymerase sigma factor [Roseimicrobium gellanilyticum]RBP37362.1 RNA polymerase sigma-70 factor (ECF subfamily) [Roseimicrobium gellanilyticum]
MSPSENERHHRFLRAFTAQEPVIRAYVRRLLPTRADADDVMQEVSVVLWDKFDSFQADGDFRSWAFGVARYEVLAWLRDKGRDKLVLDETVVTKLADESAEREPHLERQREALEACMQKVPADQRILLMQAYQPQARMQEVAEASGRTSAGFYQWLHRMRRMLMDCIRRALAQEVSS